MNLGNNHLLDFRRAGKEEMIAYLTEAGVQFFIPFAFISYNEFLNSPIYGTVAEIKRARTGGYVPVVYAHWGEEYQPATEKQKASAHTFVDAGAELVIGSHPHVVQKRDRYGGKWIHYSLGNFIFDQYWSDSVRRGLLLRVLFSGEDVAGVEEIPITLETDGRTCVTIGYGKN